MFLAKSGEWREYKNVRTRFPSCLKHLTSTFCAPPPLRRSGLQREFPRLPQSHWPCPSWDCSRLAQSCQCRFDATPLFARGLDGSIFLLPDAVATPRQRRLKIPNDGDAFLHAATSGGITRIRLYSCCGLAGRYAGFPRAKTDAAKLQIQ
jgi:hypothetical protein